MKTFTVQAPIVRSIILLVCWSVLACSKPGRLPPSHGREKAKPWKTLRETTWEWTEAECVGGALDLASRGFAQQLRIQEAPGGLLLLEDMKFAGEDCARTVVRLARPGPEPGSWAFEEQARIALPLDRPCGNAAEPESRGVIRATGKLLEVVHYRSGWCGGFDARFAYSRAEASPLSALQLIRHWAAHFNRRDAEAIAALYAATGSLVEPFTPTPEGVPRRHDGKAAIRRWYADAFASVPWLALRLLSVSDRGKPGHHVADWQYMDPALARPFSGRNLFIIAGGEIFESEVQLTTEIVSRDYGGTAK